MVFARQLLNRLIKLLKRLASLKRTVCPYCFETISLSDTAFRCSRDDCGSAEDPVLIKHWNDKTPVSTYFKPERRNFLAWRQTKANCTNCGTPTTKRICQNCHKELPHSFGFEQPLMIAVVGEQNSGKSHMIAVLIDELKRRCGDAFDFSLMPLNDATASRYKRDFYEPLFNDGKVLSKTDSAKSDWTRAEPLVYRLQFKARGGQRGAVATISFFDAPGEDLQADDVVSRLSKYVYHSDGLILLVDTESFLEKQARVQRKSTTQAADILARIIRLYERGRQIPATKTLPASLAITLSKVDLLKSQFPASTQLWENPNHRGMFDYADFSLTSAEIESKLHELGAPDLCNLARQRFGEDDVGFFGMSAIGHKPTNDNSVNNIDPLRVAEPILWLLSRQGMVPTTEMKERA